MSVFSDLPRVWCDICEGRTLKVRTRHGVCQECIRKAIERMEHDDEMNSLRGLSDEERERV